MLFWVFSASLCGGNWKFYYYRVRIKRIKERTAHHRKDVFFSMYDFSENAWEVTLTPSVCCFQWIESLALSFLFFPSFYRSLSHFLSLGICLLSKLSCRIFLHLFEASFLLEFADISLAFFHLFCKCPLPPSPPLNSIYFDLLLSSFSLLFFLYFSSLNI